MFVSRSEEIAFFSIHRDRLVTGAYAMSTSFDGSGPGSMVLRTNRSRAGAECSPGSVGFQSVAGATSGSSATFRGPTRRSSSGAIDFRQLAAATSRSAALIVTCASFSASANVAGETAGPDSGPVPKAGGAPGVSGVAVVRPPAPPPAGCRSRRHAAAEPTIVAMRNCLRVRMAGHYTPSGLLPATPAVVTFSLLDAQIPAMIGAIVFAI